MKIGVCLSLLVSEDGLAYSFLQWKAVNAILYHVINKYRFRVCKHIWALTDSGAKAKAYQAPTWC